jgi:hypothetical protein
MVIPVIHQSFPFSDNSILLVRFSFHDSLSFLAKKKSEGGISSGKIGVRSPTKVSSELGFLKLVCRGVNDAMGEAISVECCCPVVFGVPTEVVGVE